MEFLIFLAATVSRSSISHPPDHCWTLVTLVSLSAVFYNSTQVLCRSVLPSEVTDCRIGKGKDCWCCDSGVLARYTAEAETIDEGVIFRALSM